jgi:hypothetical protein
MSKEFSFLVTNDAERTAKIASMVAKFPNSIDAVTLPSSKDVDLAEALNNPELTNEQVSVMLAVVEETLQNVGNVVMWGDVLEEEQEEQEEQEVPVAKTASIAKDVLISTFAQQSHVRALGFSDEQIQECLGADGMQPVLQQCNALSKEAAQFVVEAKRIVLGNDR